jgi:hypothetical protein
MSANLKGDEDDGEQCFRINPLRDSAEQLVIDEEYTEWSWDVFPTRSGRHRLYLSVSVLLFPPGGGPRRQVKVEEQVVTVRISPAYRLKRYWTNVVSFATGGVGLYILQFVWRRLRRFCHDRKQQRIIISRS